METIMKALVKTEKGPGHLTLMERPVPQIGDDDLLVQVKAAGICGSDIRMKNLGNSENLRPPVILGHEFSGVIAAVGKHIKGFEIGQRVVSDNSGDLCGKCDMCAKRQLLNVCPQSRSRFRHGRRFRPLRQNIRAPVIR